MITWTAFQPKFQNLNGQTVLSDVANHCPNYSYFRVAGDQPTSAHEGTHGVHAEIRNERGGKPSFYVLNNMSITLDELKCRKRDCIPFLPASLHMSRFALYVQGQSEWDASPSYLFDEAIAYVNGAACALDIDKGGHIDESDNIFDMGPPDDFLELPDYLRKVHRCYLGSNQKLVTGDGSDRIFGAVEFIAYCTAVLMAAAKNGPLDQQWCDFADWHFNRAMQLHKDGSKVYPWDDENKCVEILTTSQDPLVVAMRDFQKSVLGFDITGGPAVNPYLV